MKLKVLVGSGDRIGLFALPVLLIGLPLNLWRPSLFTVGGPPRLVAVLALAALVPGVVIWLWSVVLILTRVPRRQLITTGPYALVKHPLYTGVALLVLPSIGLLLDSWLGLVIGAALYAGSRRYAPEEERVLSRLFGAAWDDYRARVKLPWL